MPTLYVENVPDDVYEALRERARERRTSIAAETIAVLHENVPTRAELKRRQETYEAFLRLQRETPAPHGPRVSTVKLLHEARAERDQQLAAVVRKPRRGRKPGRGQ